MDPFESEVLAELNSILAGQAQARAAQALQATADATLQAANAALFQINQAIIILQGLAAQQSLDESVLGAIYGGVRAIQADIPAAGQPVVLPEPPPPGYGGNSAGDLQAGVWGGTNPATGDTYGDDAAFVYQWADQQSTEGRLLRRSAFFQEFINPPDWYNNNAIAAVYVTPVFPLASIVPNDTLLQFLQAENPDYVWTLGLDGAHYVGQLVVDDFGYPVYSTCLLTELEFSKLITNPRPTPPVWPGLTKVTLGASVALATALTVVAPMDGIIVAITAPPAGHGSYNYAGVFSYQNVGSLSFYSDNGDQEFQLALGFTSAVYCPRAMTRAAGVKIRTAPGLTGTVTPWTVS